MNNHVGEGFVQGGFNIFHKLIKNKLEEEFLSNVWTV